MTTIDEIDPRKILYAIKYVRDTPGLRTAPGIKTLSAIYKSKEHTITRDDLSNLIGDALDLHFGWFCNRVAETSGATPEGTFCLCDTTTDAAGRRVYILKPAVVAALKLGFGPKK